MNNKIAALIFLLLVLTLVVVGCSRNTGEVKASTTGDSVDSFGDDVNQLNDSDIAVDDSFDVENNATLEDI